MTKLEPENYRNYSIRVYCNGTEIMNYSGKSYIYFGDKNNDGFHFIDENGKHHRIYGGTVIVNEQ